ncbi:MAG: hypothetical protein KOO66_05760 [Bacteroidales bacterium]|nr:hypothetical protein [Bacteroidales bacterium]
MQHSKKYPDYIFLSSNKGVWRAKIKISGEDINFYDFYKFNKINENVLRLEIDTAGNIWAATKYNGLYYIEFENNEIDNFKIQRFTYDHGLPQINDNYPVLIDDKIFIATRKGLFEPIFNDSVFLIKLLIAKLLLHI